MVDEIIFRPCVHVCEMNLQKPFRNMSVFLAFGQVVKGIPFRKSNNENILTWQQDSTSWIIVLKESVRDIGVGIHPIGVSTLSSSHINYLQDFVNAVITENISFTIRPEWIIINDAPGSPVAATI